MWRYELTKIICKILYKHIGSALNVYFKIFNTVQNPWKLPLGYRKFKLLGSVWKYLHNKMLASSKINVKIRIDKWIGYNIN